MKITNSWNQSWLKACFDLNEYMLLKQYKHIFQRHGPHLSWLYFDICLLNPILANTQQMHLNCKTLYLEKRNISLKFTLALLFAQFFLHFLNRCIVSISCGIRLNLNYKNYAKDVLTSKSVCSFQRAMFFASWYFVSKKM